jgi:hypothetical protein
MSGSSKLLSLLFLTWGEDRAASEYHFAGATHNVVVSLWLSSNSDGMFTLYGNTCNNSIAPPLFLYRPSPRLIMFLKPDVKINNTRWGTMLYQTTLSSHTLSKNQQIVNFDVMGKGSLHRKEILNISYIVDCIWDLRTARSMVVWIFQTDNNLTRNIGAQCIPKAIRIDGTFKESNITTHPMTIATGFTQ